MKALMGNVIQTNLFHFQGDFGPPGFPGPTGPGGVGIQGEKVSVMSSDMLFFHIGAT